MIGTIIVLFFLAGVAGISNSIMDVVSFHYYESIFRKWSWFNPLTSWKNKWKLDKSSYGDAPIRNEKRLWYYLWLYKPEYKERFFYSSTVLVFLTDPWHFFKWLTFTCVELSVMIALLGLEKALYFWYLVVVGVLTQKVVRGLFFTLFYDQFFTKKK